jgi:MFS family permease
MSSGFAVTHRKLLAVGLIGSSIEWYDFFLYSTAAALAFPRIFFPGATVLTGTLLAFSTFWAGFLARPLGGVIAGHFGDRLGRKPVVTFCLTLMTLSTFLIGCLPGATSIGLLAPVLLVTLRLVQGLACGGQWGGIVLLLTESTGPKRRGFAGTFGQMSVPFGSILGTVIFLAATASLTNEQFLSWGWRIPFLCSAIMAPVVLYIQHKVEDTPVFRELSEQAHAESTQRRISSAPLTDVLRSNWRRILMGAGLLAGTNALFYISTAGLLSYGTRDLHMSRDGLLSCSLLSSVATFAFIAWGGSLSDRYGRRPVILVGGLGMLAWAVPYFWLIDSASLALVFVSVAVAAVFQSISYGPVAAYLGELFAPNVRYSGVSMAYQLAAITVSGGTPALTTFLIASTGSTALVSAYIALAACITILCAWKLPETNPERVRADPYAAPGTQLTSARS